MKREMSKIIIVLGLVIAVIGLPLGIGTAKANKISIILKDSSIDSKSNPIQSAQDIRISLWNVYKQRPGDLNPDGSINTSASHYGGYQTVFTVTPDNDRYFTKGTYGLVNIDYGALPDFPVIAPFNAYLQMEYKNHGDPDTSYQIYDFMDDLPWNNVERLLIDPQASYYTLEAGPQTNYNTFTLDANNNAPTAVKLQFGETLAEYLQWNIANIRFELSDNLYIDGSLTLNGHLDFGLNEMVNARLENLDRAPDCDEKSMGRLYFNTSDNLPYYCNGNDWRQL